MDDKFLSYFILFLVNGGNFLALNGKYYLDEKPIVVERVCTGDWFEDDKFKRGVNFARNYVFVILVIQIIVGIPTAYFKHCFKKLEKNGNKTDLGSLIASFAVGFIFMIDGVAFFAMQKLSLENLNQYPGKLLVHMILVGCPLLIVTTKCILIFVSTPKLRRFVCHKLFNNEINPS